MPDLPLRASDPNAGPRRSRLAFTAAEEGLTVASRFVLAVARLAGEPRLRIGLSTRTNPEAQTAPAPAVRGDRAVTVEFPSAATLGAALEVINSALRAAIPPAGPSPETDEAIGDAASVGILLAGTWDARTAVGTPLALLIGAGGTSFLDYDADRLPGGVAEALADALADPRRWAALEQSWTALDLLGAALFARVLGEWNATRLELGSPDVIHRWFEAQVARSPSAVALVFEHESLTYEALNQRANQLAHHLVTLGVGPEVLVGLCCERSLGMVVAMIGILKAGGAYVPIDPAYPPARVSLMLEDSQVAVLVTEESVLGELPAHRASVVCLDRDAALLARQPTENLSETATGHALAYCIYTSGSTGRPKAVMVEHRNVWNFFAAMDERLGTAPGVWLAVTSLSFDISVLELLWTLGRGYTVVILADERRSTAPGPAAANADLPISFSLFYFSADQGAEPRDRYRLLLDGARYADMNGFSAVWTPERHFHAFGGLYPNPAVTGAAVAAVTSRIAIRAGSCVLPLHHPARVAEEWAVVDNLSGGRVGVSFAAGWQPDDFLLNPAGYADAKSRMVSAMEQVRSLWRGDALTFEGPRGPVAVRTMPRPIQAELPVWFTTAGNPESYELAGRLGVHVLTHLLGQSVEELAEKITRYRRAWRQAGHQGEGSVALMLHAFLGEDDDAVKDLVRAPMKAYLGTSVSLIKGYAAAFPIFRKPADGGEAALDFNALTPDEMDGLLEFSFERYYESSGLFGTVERCEGIVDRLKGIGVNEVACLVDFGLEPSLVLSHLKYINRLRLRTSRARAEPADFSLPAQISRHRVTHLQCTPSLAALLLADDRSREALRRLRVVCIGGEALPRDVAAALRSLVPGEVWNMYGPTETTVWSTMHLVDDGPGPIPLGRPLANTAVYVLDRFGQPTLPGWPGELCIGGSGVTRGYLRQPELTRERFVPDPFAKGQDSRMYRTGDLASWREDGILEFLGRTDHQVKIRGHRIELGEIEACLRTHPGVGDAAVMAREVSPGDQRLIAYVVGVPPVPDAGTLRQFVMERLPQPMWLASVVFLPALPLTPNGKLDRTSLPTPTLVAPEPMAQAPENPPSGDLEGTVSKIWNDLLQVAAGPDDNFFDLGGHSLLAVRVHARLEHELGVRLPIVDLFRFPTIRTLAAHLARGAPPARQAEAGERAQSRRTALQRRLARRFPE